MFFVFRHAVRGEAHEFVFPRIYFEPAVVSESRVKEAEGMGKTELGKELDVVFISVGDAGGGPLPHSVHREDGSLRKWRGEKSGGGVRLVMFREKDFAFERNFFCELVFEPDFFLQPERD